MDNIPHPKYKIGDIVIYHLKDSAIYVQYKIIGAHYLGKLTDIRNILNEKFGDQPLPEIGWHYFLDATNEDGTPMKAIPETGITDCL